MLRRLKLLFGIILLFFIIISIRLFFLQIVSYENFGGLAEEQRSNIIKVPPIRGKIMAVDGSALVINQKAYAVILEPQKIKDKTNLISILAKELEMAESSISAKIEDNSLLWVPIIHKVDESVAEKVKNYKLPGVTFVDETKRYYPEASMAAHLLGFIGNNSKGEDEGYFGLEGYYDEQLRGREGIVFQEKDAYGNPILAGRREVVTTENGRNLFLHIDKTMQFIVEKHLKTGIEKYQAKGGTIIVMDPENGGILAMASYPSYNPGDYYNYRMEYYKNPAISLTYEPGSTFKVLVMAAAINEGKITPDTKFNEEGPIKMGEYEIETWNQKYHGNISMTEVLQYSSNVGMVFVEQQLENTVYYNYLKNLGFDSLTGIDLQEEVAPKLREKNKWYEMDYASASFGQGIAVTPLQMVRAVAAIANGGKLVVPRIVKKIELPTGEVINIEPKIERTVYKKETAKIITEMMIAAVDNGETRSIKPLGYKIAGKTGTAQIPIAGHYDKDKTIASFIGFAPPHAPRFLMLVSLYEPTASTWGSETAAPIFFAIAKEFFSYLGISPTD